MKKILRVFFVLVLTAALVVPQAGLFFQKDVTPSVAAEDDALYLSELKVGYSYPDESADAGIKALENEGFTVLKDEEGNIADLVKHYKKFTNRNHVYLGYKTTNDPKEAITDICFMRDGDCYTVEKDDPTVAHQDPDGRYEEHKVNGLEPIPRTLYAKWYNDERYEAVKCNRREGKTDQEKAIYSIQGDAADLYGDGGNEKKNEWTALYVAKDEDESPILAKSFMFSPWFDDYESSFGVHYFYGSKEEKNEWADNLCPWKDKGKGIPYVLILYERGKKIVRELVAESEKAAGSDGDASVAGSIFSEVETQKKSNYLSELKVGYSYPDESVDAGAKALEKEGFTVLKKDNGSYADLISPNSDFTKTEHVFLGYKTTSDPKEAITDIAIMGNGDKYTLREDDLNTADKIQNKKYIDEKHPVSTDEAIPWTIYVDFFDNERYDVVKCNRRTGKTSWEMARFNLQEDSSDLLGDGGDDWVALYTSKSENGAPILADTLRFSDDYEDMQWYSDSLGAHYLQLTDTYNKDIYPVNIDNRHNSTVLILYDYADKTVKDLVSANTANGEATTAGTMVSTSFTWTIVIGVAALALGLIVGLLIGRGTRREKAVKKEE